MYFKVVMNAEEGTEKDLNPIVRYIETENVNTLFGILEKYYGLGGEQPAARIRMFRTVDRDEFTLARDMNRGTLH